MRRVATALACAVLLLVGLTACSSSKSTATTTTPPWWETVPTVDLRGKATGTPPQVHVQVADNTFTPEVVRIDPGVTVVWTHQGVAVHNIIKLFPNQNFGGQFGVDKLASGGTYQYTFATPGSYKYSCTLHTGMLGLVAVGNASL